MKHILALLYLLLLLPLSTAFGATFVVTSNADDGPGSLRQAIINGNGSGSSYTINFATAGPISLTAVLPDITRPCVISGFTPLNPATATGGTTIERSPSAGNFRIFKAATDGTTLVLQDLILQNGVGNDGNDVRGGGALLAELGSGSLTMSRCLVRNCSVTSGRNGAGVQLVSGSAIITDCQFSNNNATTGASFGGGFHTGRYSAMNPGYVNFLRCTFISNQADYGAGLYHFGGSATLTNCTFSQNAATAIGNALYIKTGNVDLIQVSFIRNKGNTEAPVYSGDTRNIVNSGNTRLVNCLFAGNINSGSGTGNFFNDGTITSLGGNVSNEADDNVVLNSADITGLDPNVGSLQNNGGLVLTHSIPLSSPAHNAGVTSTTGLTLPTTDANNQPRICLPDAGAFEVQDVLASLTATNDGILSCSNPSLLLTATATGGSNYTYTLIGPGLSTNSPSNTAIVSQAGTFTVLSQSVEGCIASATLTVSGNPTVVSSAGSITLIGTASCDSPVRLTAPATGQAFVFTGPGGYVFSNVYRTPGNYTAFAEGIRMGGTYTLNVYGSTGCLPATSTIVVQGPANCP